VGIRDQIRGNAAYVVVLVLIVAAVIYLIIAPGHWRRGTAVLSSALFLAGAARAVLPSPRAGALAVRTRWLDSAAYWLLCAVMVAVTVRLHE
jgi:type IV secretory pathway VirB2 component (pilin)